jgi:hypothetical protein
VLRKAECGIVFVPKYLARGVLKLRLGGNVEKFWQGRSEHPSIRDAMQHGDWQKERRQLFARLPACSVFTLREKIYL